ncbi:MAG: alpha-amylase [Owenweeksia sp.]|nr:alpha-amylase [Owenweeksia sp.]MBF98004.1 alpha-amylase [Owenweeksia sp.]HBF21350.1 alpha-amylase [Cryomorphaceae bacterium]HCQ15920.1 alpha-amylase [Cryomorphaceae bacterium]|tara:strand:- start:151 stop:1515 length:1365 start_codon:yes stop_codon:yes gene_type:complete
MKKSIGILGLVTLVWACNGPVVKEAEPVDNDTTASLEHPAWSKHSSIYEVNIRQYTPEGTFNAFKEHLPHLKELGVEILWIMPVQPIGEKNRKGKLGSYYSIKDYTAVNPEFGTMEDFKGLVNEAHDMGFKVILDWVGNHSAWDHPWMEQHPDWYTRNDSGKVIPPVEDWFDVADLNYEAPGMQEEMMNALKFWVKEADVDGYRCDVAMMVPMDFWNRARKSLDSIKPVFMLAEAEGPEFHEQAFDMTYGWEFHHIMNQIAKGEEPVSALDTYLIKMDTLYPESAYRMYFTTNHDENSWNGTIGERMGANHKNFFVLATTFPYGMPLIYSGQEAGLNKRLSFFDKDTINWEQDTVLFDFYQQMIRLKSDHEALANGADQGDFERIATDDASKMYAYVRSKGNDKMLVILNFSDQPGELTYQGLSSIDLLAGRAEKGSQEGAVKVAANDFTIIGL